MLNNLIFTKIKIDTTGVIDDELAEPFNTLIPTACHYTHHNTPPTQHLPGPPGVLPSTPPDTTGQTTHSTMILSGHSSSKTTWVPPAGFEPALPPPESGTRSSTGSELTRGLARHGGARSGAVPNGCPNGACGGAVSPVCAAQRGWSG